MKAKNRSVHLFNKLYFASSPSTTPIWHRGVLRVPSYFSSNITALGKAGSDPKPPRQAAKPGLDKSPNPWGGAGSKISEPPRTPTKARGRQRHSSCQRPVYGGTVFVTSGIPAGPIRPDCRCLALTAGGSEYQKRGSGHNTSRVCWELSTKFPNVTMRGCVYQSGTNMKDSAAVTLGCMAGRASRAIGVSGASGVRLQGFISQKTSHLGLNGAPGKTKLLTGWGWGCSLRLVSADHLGSAKNRRPF